MSTLKMKRSTALALRSSEAPPEETMAKTNPRATILSDRFSVLKPEVVPECGGLIRRRHEGGSERDRGRMHAEGTVRDRRLDNEQTSTSDMHSDTSEY